MTDAYEHLKDRIAASIRRAPEGKPFLLASGQQSTYYINLREAVLGDASSMLYAGAVLHRLLPFEVESLGGIPTAGLPLLGAVLSQCALLDGSIRPRSGFYTRATPKSHGLGQQVEGMPKGVACLIEDTITTAGSAIEHALIARENGVDVRYVACLFDRQEGGVQALQEHGISLLAAYRADQFL